MPASSDKNTASGGTGSCLISELHPLASHLRASDGRDIPFTRAMLTLRNACGSDVTALVPHISLAQESGTVQDVSHAVAGSAVALPPGGSITWDVFDVLLHAHPGTASRVNMFGYRAVLNWTFDLALWAEYRLTGASGTVRGPVSRWMLRWSLADAGSGAVGLVIEDVGEERRS